MATANMMKEHAFYRRLDISQFTTQVELIHGTRRGTLDFVGYFDKTAKKGWQLYKTGAITEEELKTQMKDLPSPILVDFKTTASFSVRELDPKIYCGQLWYYQQLVKAITGHTARCYTLVGDKDSTRKMVQLFEYSQESLDEVGKKVEEVERFFWKSVKDNSFPSAKQLRGIEQNCFRCSECSHSPFSPDGQPYIV
jgi:hypothetical protein